MTALIEQAVAAYLTPLVSGVTVLPGASAEDQETAVPQIIVSSAEGNRDAGTLWYADLQISVVTPAPQQTVADHTAVVAAVESAMQDANFGAIVTAVATSGLTLDGLWQHSQRDEHGHNSRWRTVLGFTLGVQRAL